LLGAKGFHTIYLFRHRWDCHATPAERQMRAARVPLLFVNNAAARTPLNRSRTTTAFGMEFAPFCSFSDFGDN
jgi:hypothetical protein